MTLTILNAIIIRTQFTVYPVHAITHHLMVYTFYVWWALRVLNGVPISFLPLPLPLSLSLPLPLPPSLSPPPCLPPSGFLSSYWNLVRSTLRISAPSTIPTPPQKRNPLNGKWRESHAKLCIMNLYLV